MLTEVFRTLPQPLLGDSAVKETTFAPNESLQIQYPFITLTSAVVKITERKGSI
jgi:hypothetical protein